jgi:hypothetical protein
VWHYNPTKLRPKKLGGKPREIDAPLARLKHIQRRINSVLLTDLWLPDSVHAYRQRRSIKTAAEPHKGRPFLWVADIRQLSAFRTIGYMRCSWSWAVFRTWGGS